MKHTELFVDEDTGDIIEVQIDDQKINMNNKQLKKL